ncbi:MAG: substrate-binding domain-containing protein [Gaiellales bacterium]
MRALATIAAAVVLAAVMTGSAGAAASRAHDLAGASASANPSTDLVDAQFVDLSWSGFTPGAPVYVFECARTATNVGTQCVQPSFDIPHYTSTSTGTGIVRYGVQVQSFGKFQCDDTHLCSIDLLENPTDLSSGVRVPITFARPPGACPTATTPPVAGEGASPAAYTIYKWENQVCNLPSHLNVTYTNDNSYDGMSGFVNSSPNSNFAVTGVPLPGSQAQKLSAGHRGYAYAPLTLTALSVAYNIVDQQGHQVTHLVLTPRILAEIATGNLGTFNCPPTVSDSDCVNLYGGDPEIRNLNPGVQFPSGPIQFLIRAEHSASNLAFTSWMSATAPDVWTYGTATTWPPPDPHPCPTCPGGVQGENITALGVGAPQTYTPDDIYIGVIDSTYAALNDVPVASIENPGQPAGVAPTAASLAAAVSDGTKNADGTITPSYDTTDPNAYPLPMLTYAIVPTTKRWPNFTADDGKMLKGFLAFAAGAGQKVLPNGSFPLPAAQAAQTTAIAAKIPTSEPVPPGGGHHQHHNGQGAGTGTGSAGTGSGTGGGASLGGGGGSSGGGNGGSGPGSGKSPHTKVKPVHAKPLAYTLTAKNLSSSSSGAIVPVLAALALFGIVFGPAVLLFSRSRSALSGRSLRGMLRRPGTGGGAVP